ncbi:helix-turn-helix domain-containing protein [Streptomyces sp. H27-D2]|uniref:helix-turn-helix domain-containing protein n=1 Tax=Streptomyces sp. H27-D2 TaxID=3046304 RepID=UPI002DB8AA5D|nr:XRE family transcriptional regulator [Streptomyces sp. H27-D2]MEC4017352.1 XRE family transcriptional regulator [Streptomyces sp. H27-D2]
MDTGSRARPADYSGGRPGSHGHDTREAGPRGAERAVRALRADPSRTPWERDAMERERAHERARSRPERVRNPAQGRAGRMLGTNLRALRAERGLSLSEVARRSGLAKSALSQLESGQGNPTIQTVFSLSNALQVAVSDLLTERTEPEVLLVRSAGLEVLSSEAVELRMLRRIEPKGGVMEVYDQRIRPGARQHSNGHPGLEHIVVTAGVLLVGPPEEPYELGPGDYVRLSGARPHIYEAVGEVPVVSVLLIEYPPGAGIDPPGMPH